MENYFIGESGRLESETCADVDDYLQKTKMKRDGVNGTCVELYAFAQLAHVDVYVYQCRYSSCAVYSFAGDRTDVDMVLLLIVNNWTGNHFDALRMLAVQDAAARLSPESTGGLRSAHKPPIIFSTTSASNSKIVHCLMNMKIVMYQRIMNQKNLMMNSAVR